jgi:hypothetical protein
MPDPTLSLNGTAAYDVLTRRAICGRPCAEDAQLFNAMHSVQTEIVTKLYMYYKEAWWQGLTLVHFSAQLERFL